MAAYEVRVPRVSREGQAPRRARRRVHDVRRRLARKRRAACRGGAAADRHREDGPRPERQARHHGRTVHGNEGTPGRLLCHRGARHRRGDPDGGADSAGARRQHRSAPRQDARCVAAAMPGHECYHCRQWIEEGEPHDCWTTTEAALTAELSDDLRDAWERLRETAVEFGDQRIYASHNSIMFARKTCYFFVRPKRSFLEVCVFLPRTVKAPQVRRTDKVSAAKTVHIIPIRHRDEVEAPITDWLREAYEFSAQKPP